MTADDLQTRSDGEADKANEGILEADAVYVVSGSVANQVARSMVTRLKAVQHGEFDLGATSL